MLDADIRSFFDSVDHEWMMRMLSHRIADERILRLIRKWLKAWILEGGAWRASAGDVSFPFVFPLLWANPGWTFHCEVQDAIEADDP